MRTIKIDRTAEAVDPRRKNFLTESEIAAFLASARKGRHGVRDFLLAVLAFRHGLRVSELVGMRRSDLDIDSGHLFVQRKKGSMSTNHPLAGDEIRAIRAWLRVRAKCVMANSPLLFLSERGPMTRQAFNYLCAKIGRRAGLAVKVYPHMLRHSCGYALANKGHDTRLIGDFLGHRNIQHTMTYTRTASVRFEGLWG